MSLPNVMINFKQTGATVIQRGERGIVALVLIGETQEVQTKRVSTSGLHGIY